MLTVGVDLATQPTKTAMASIEWLEGGARVVGLDLRVPDAAILDSALHAEIVGIDAPFGWPEAFIAFLSAHRDDRQGPPDPNPDAARRILAFRETDRVVAAATGNQPLSVATNLLGLTAMRASGLLAALRDRGEPVERAGFGRVVEVYPAASMRCWGLPVVPYKGTNPAGLTGMVDALLGAAPWLDLGSFEHSCRTSDDAFDAVIASLTARSRAIGNWIPPGDDQRTLASREGWIVLPSSDLNALPSL